MRALWSAKGDYECTEVITLKKLAMLLGRKHLEIKGKLRIVSWF